MGEKPETERWAVARAAVVMSPETLSLLESGNLKKGDVRSTAELAGIMAAKQTSDLIPLCHPIPLDHVDVTIEMDKELPGVQITSTVRTKGRTGAEMEALTGVTIAALTVYDMVKAVERGVRITDVRLVEKHGGRSGDVILED